MSIFGAMFSGVSALAAQSHKISAISDNIANANTIGYKRSDVPFSTMVTSQTSKTAYSAGGIRSAPLMQVDKQGLLQSTSSSTDLAINGKGFFVVSTKAEKTFDGSSQSLFTRAGNFSPDADGYLRNASGYYLRGWKLNSDGSYANGEPARTSVDGMETVNVLGLSFAGTATSKVKFGGNLPAAATEPAYIDRTFSTSLEYYDPIGNARTMTLEWQPKLTAVPPRTLAGTTANTPTASVQFALDPTATPVLAGDTFRFQIGGADAQLSGITGATDGALVGSFNSAAKANNLKVELVNTGAGAFELRSLEPGKDVAATSAGGNFMTGSTTLANAATTAASTTVTNTTIDLSSAVQFKAGDSLSFTDSAGTARTYTFDGTENAGNLQTKLTAWMKGSGAPNTSFAFDNTTNVLTLTANNATGSGVTAGSFGVSAGKVSTYGAWDLNVVDAKSKNVLGSFALDFNTAGTRAGSPQSIVSTGPTPITFVDARGNAITPSNIGDPMIARLNVPLDDGSMQTIDLSLGEIGNSGGVTQYAGDYVPSLLERDGAEFASLDRIEFDSAGTMNAVFDNGLTRPLYKIPLVDFVNPNGLTPVDGNAFQASSDAGAFYLWDAGSGPVGQMVGSSLEGSTVDIAEEFSNMIIAQRAYSSNAKIIQTADEMLQEITNLKR